MNRRTFLISATAGLSLGSCRPPAGTSRRAAATRERLLEYARGLDIVDAHEHLVPESVRLETEVDALTLLSIYVFRDLRNAGMPSADLPHGLAGNFLLDTSIPLEDRWNRIAPYLPRVRQHSAFRVVRLTLRGLFGVDDLTESTYREVTEKIRESNRPGCYDEILQQRCRISCAITQRDHGVKLDPTPLLRPVLPLLPYYLGLTKALLEHLEQRVGHPIDDLDAYLAAVDGVIDEEVAGGIVGLKIYPIDPTPPDIDRARESFRQMKKGAPPSNVWRATVLDHLLAQARQHALPVAVHTGAWGDFREVDPKVMIGWIERHPDVRFDLYHLGMPFVRDSIFIAWSQTNAYLNLSWTYALSETITRRAIPEILDQIPMHKVIGFGGDFRWDVENVYGHLEMARDILATTLAERVEAGRIDEAGARYVLDSWLRDNPAELYRLGTRGG